jgi:hypothetical protein
VLERHAQLVITLVHKGPKHPIRIRQVARQDAVQFPA